LRARLKGADLALADKALVALKEMSDREKIWEQYLERGTEGQVWWS
jgi:hypothetical protein